MILDNWLAQRAETCPDRVAVIAGGVEVTYEELEAEASRGARRLAARGVRRGGNVVIAQPSGLEYVITLHALMKLGAVVHPLNPGLAPNELDAEVERAKPALVIGESEHVTMS
ncbi:MAG TPA: class I adenylate-forming enzyme family protein, partial [Solirubrobacterales bacterium]|nr:class I adenylate-forming enzyme family protein [Solirubrobacterales bacterium]